MPELPEVETVKRSLEPHLKGRKITGISLAKPVVIAHPGAREFLEAVVGSEIVSLGRRGKFLQIFLDKGLLAVHLRMTGQLVLASPETAAPKHTHLIFTLDDGKELRFTDIRRFGRIWFIPEGEEDTYSGIGKLGPEPFSPEFDFSYLKAKLQNRKINIKQALLDQAVVAGLGNIYVDECLFAAGIMPSRSVSRLNDEEWQKLVQVIPEILEESIKSRGTSFRDYRDGLGQKGNNSSNLKVYQRKGQPCQKCKQPISRMVVAQRSTFYCGQCQK